jgi:hypothetical protein
MPSGESAANQHPLLALQGAIGNRSVSRLLLRDGLADPMEFISATSQADVTTGTNPNRATGQRGQMDFGSSVVDRMRVSGWRTSFVEAARGVAETNAALGVFQRPGSAHEFGRSANLTTGAPALREALVFSNSRFPSGQDIDPLPDTRDFASPTGELTQALNRDYGTPNVHVHRQVTPRQIAAQIRAAIHHLHAALPPGARAELLLDFEGHGSSGNFVGSDGHDFQLSELLHLGREGRDLGVHLVAVSDVCFQGLGVVWADAQALSTTQQRVSHAGRASEPLLREKLDAAEELLFLLEGIGDQAQDLFDAIDAVETATTRGATPTQAQLDAVEHAHHALHTGLSGHQATWSHPPAHVDHAVASAWLEVWQDSLGHLIFPTSEGHKMLDDLGAAMHLSYNAVTQLIESVNRALVTPSAAAAAPATAPPTAAARGSGDAGLDGGLDAGAGLDGGLDAGRGGASTGNSQMDAGIPDVSHRDL